MYSASELSNMFEVSRKTIYEKFKCEELLPYVKDTKQGKRLETEGFNVLRLLLSNSKVTQVNSTVTPESNTSVTPNNTIETNYTSEYIQSLKDQLERVIREKEELQTRYDLLFNSFIAKQTVLESVEQKKKRGFFSNIFGNNQNQ